MSKKRWLAIGGLVVVAAVTLLMWPRHAEPLAPPATKTDCKRQLERLRAEVRDYYQKNGQYPKELFDPINTIGVPEEYKCPTSTRNYSYDPKSWPDTLVICTLPEHDDL